MTTKELLAKIEALEAENTRLAQAASLKVYLKVSEKGAASLYGMGQFPITLYAKQWRTVIGMSKTIEQFLEDHSADLSTGKDDPRFADARAASKLATAAARESNPRRNGPVISK